MNYYRLLGRAAVSIAIPFFALSSAFAAVVNVDLATKKAESDSPSLEARVQRVVGKQISISVRSNTTQPQVFTLKVTGLEPGQQDVYINAKYVGKQPDTAFSNGYQLKLPGRDVNADQLRCLESLRDRVKDEIGRMSKLGEGEPARILYTLRQADSWVSSTLQAERNMRAVDVIIAPADMVLQLSGRSLVRTKEEVAQSFLMSCKLFHDARTRMYTAIKDPIMQNAAVVALTPVDFASKYSVVNSKPVVEARVINNSNMPISGKAGITMPTGWKAVSKNLAFKDLAPGKTHVVNIELVPAKPGDTPPANVVLRVDVRIGPDTKFAKLWLESTVAAGESNTVPVVPVAEVKPLPFPINPTAGGK